MNIKILATTAFLSCIAGGIACSSPAKNANVPANVASAADTGPTPEATPGGVDSHAVTPEVLVKDLYKQHGSYQSPFFQTINRPRVDKYFTQPLADLIWLDATTAKGYVGAIEADPIFDAQDTRIENLNVERSAIDGDTATVPVTFENFEKKQKVTFALKKVDGMWRIDDIKYAKGNSLMKLLQDAYPGGAPMAAGGFTGKYQVGDTTCTVKPVMTEFEVVWEKGKGAETFVAKENNTFESSANAGQSTKFVFTNEKYDSGVFYRADGETVPVKRAK